MPLNAWTTTWIRNIYFTFLLVFDIRYVPMCFLFFPLDTLHQLTDGMIHDCGWLVNFFLYFSILSSYKENFMCRQFFIFVSGLFIFLLGIFPNVHSWIVFLFVSKSLCVFSETVTKHKHSVFSPEAWLKRRYYTIEKYM